MTVTRTKQHRHPLIISVRIGIGTLSCLVMTACPLSDDYYIERSSAEGSSGKSGSIAGASGTSGARATSGAGGTNDTNGAGGTNDTNGAGGTNDTNGAGGTNDTNGAGGTNDTNGAGGTNDTNGAGGTRSTGGRSSSDFTTENGGTGGDPSGSVAGYRGAEVAGATGIAGAAGSVIADCDPKACSGTCCNNVCVDPRSDPRNCGQCGNVCPAGRSCRAGTCFGWTPMTPAPATLVAREKAAYAVMGSKLFVFGGLDAQGNPLDSGAIYDKATDAWTMLPRGANLPSARQLATAIWTGLRVYVVGGYDASSALADADGARYDPSGDSWLLLSGMSTGRVAPLLAAGSNYLLAWGGLTINSAAISGGERTTYSNGATPNPWTIVTATYGSTLPERTIDSAWASTTNDAFLFGGRVNGMTKTNRGYLFSFLSGAFTTLVAGPTARWAAFAVSDGTAYYVWGGCNETTTMNDGYRYSSTGSGGPWTAVSTVAAPSARWAPSRDTGWAFAFGTDDIAIIGGKDATGVPLTDGGRFNRATNTWTAIPNWLSREAHEFGVAALLDNEIFLWGGRDGDAITATGERYLP
jgi:hypothetical protein